MFFDEARTQLAIGFCLTIMLVMYTMFQGATTTLPNTAYLKYIDRWMLFCLLVPFLVFLIEVSWELQKYIGSSKDPDPVRETANRNRNWFKTGNRKLGGWFRAGSGRLCRRRTIQILIPTLSFLFVVVYFCRVVAFYI